MIFLFSRSNIERVLENTGLVEFIDERFGTSDESEGAAAESGDGTDAPEAEGDESPDANDPDTIVANDPAELDSEPDGSEPAEIVLETEVESDPLPRDESEEQIAPDPEPETETTDAQPTTRTPEKPNVRNATVYLIRVTDDGKINTEGVSRRVYFDASPMTETIGSLLTGPNRDELNAGLLNLVPSGTRLLSASVRNGVANLNFSEEFRFNPMGVEGLVAQLKQIVYTTTEFSTVNAVQFYIEGETVTFLGSEGLRIDRPLSRDSF